MSLAAEYEYIASLKQMFGYELETNSINIESDLSGEDINLDCENIFSMEFNNCYILLPSST